MTDGKRDGIKFIIDTHRSIQELLRDLKLTKDNDVKANTVLLIRKAFQSHSTIEEQLVYPKVRSLRRDAHIIDCELNALQQHANITEVLSKLEKMSPTDISYRSQVNKLMTEMNEHFHLEESEFLPILKEKLRPKDIDTLGGYMEELSRSLEHQLMRQQEELKERTSEQLSDESEQSGGEDKAKVQQGDRKPEMNKKQAKSEEGTKGKGTKRTASPKEEKATTRQRRKSV